MKVVCIADTHLRHDFDIPDGDLLIHAGDLSMVGEEKEVKEANEFLGKCRHNHKVLIAGNHDFLFEWNSNKARALITNAIYLQDNEIEIEGLRIWGSPWSPWFNDWAFNLRNEVTTRKVWGLIPEGIDILVTHGPPFGHGDLTFRGLMVGCDVLLENIQKKKPRFHIFGHIHEGYGIFQEGETVCINASVVNGRYEPVNAPIVIEV